MTGINGGRFDPTETTEMHELWDSIDGWVDTQIERLTAAPARPDRITELETHVRRLHSWVTFCVVLTFGMTGIVIVALLQLGGWVRWFG